MKLLASAFSFSLLLSSFAFAAKPFPAPPQNYVYDDAGLLSAGAKQELFQKLSAEDRATQTQIIVGIFQSLDDEDLVDYTNRLFKAWKIGDAKKDNGALLTVFVKEHKVRIEVGYGLEPVLTDALSKRIITEVLSPAFAQKQFDQGVIQSVDTMIKIAHQEFGALPQKKKQGPSKNLLMIILFPIFILLWIISRFSPNGVSYGSNRRSDWAAGGSRPGGGFWIGGGGSGGGGGGFGGFSGGGGSSGGGGASGDW